MKILKTIFFWIWKIVSYILILLWKIISSLLISLWMIIKWIMYYIRLDSNTPRTASGSRDRRFKSTRELEYIEKGGGCGYVCGVFFILVMLLGLIVHLFSDGKENDTNKKHTNTEKKKITPPPPVIQQNKNEDSIADTTIILDTAFMEEYEIMETNNTISPISNDSMDEINEN